MDAKEIEEWKSPKLSAEAIYTEDVFKCGICKEDKFTIDDYVVHMVEEEKCVMVMEQSSCLKDLLLPKFKRNYSLHQSVENGLELSTSIAVEVEVGQGLRRWKCKACCLTFSRQAAVLNHFKLAQHPLPEGILNKEATVLINVKRENKDTSGTFLDTATFSNAFTDEKDDLKHLSANALKNSNSQSICNICGQIFKSDSIVSSHMKIVHSEDRPFVCNMDGCTLSFKTKGSLVRHVRRHTGDRPYKCLLCGRAYRESGSLLRHQQSKIPCNKKPDSHLPRYGITQPFTSSVKADNEQAECKVPLKKERSEETGEEFSSTLLRGEEEFQEAEETKAKVRKEILTSSQYFTPQSVASPGVQEKKPLLKDMKKELVGYDSDDEKESNKMDYPGISGELENGVLRRCLMCPVCCRSYAKVTYLSTHMKTHLAELRRECSTCQKRFSSNHALSRHLMSHSSVRQFECQHCGKTFKLRSHALVHLKSHSSTKSVPCPECGKCFKSVSSRNAHLKIHKGERGFECSICFKKFLVKASLMRHLRVHTKDRPFQCPHCNRGFKEQGTLKRHIRFKVPCSQFYLASSERKFKLEEIDSKSSVKENLEEREDSRVETLSEMNDNFSEVDSELESYLSENKAPSSIYSEPSDLSFSPEDYYLSFDNFEPLSAVGIKQEIVKKRHKSRHNRGLINLSE